MRKVKRQALHAPISQESKSAKPVSAGSEFLQSEGLPFPPAWAALVVVLGVVAGGLSAYLLTGSLLGRGVLGCGPASGCDAVLNSRWAYWLGIPVSLGAVATYLFVLGAMLRMRSRLRGGGAVWIWPALRVVSWLILGAALWFVGLQVAVIGAFCPYCMTAHMCGAIMALIILCRGGAGERGEGMPTPRLGETRGGRRGAELLLAILGIVILIGGQLAYEPKTYRVAETGGAVVRKEAESRPAVAQSAGNPVAALPRRTLSLYDGLFELDLRQVPLFGSPDAPHVIVSIFDYTCRHCRAIHAPLLEAQRRFSNELAIVSLPMPLDPECNRLLKRPIAEHTNACAYARLGLAVWRVAPEKLRAFDDWIFTPTRPVPPEVAARYAMELTRTNVAAQAAQDDWVHQQLELNIRLYETNHFRFRRDTLPQLLIGSNIISGTFREADLYRMLASSFGLVVLTNPPSGTR